MSRLLPEYLSILDSLKQKIRQARIKAAFSVNVELLKLYWEIGRTILEQQAAEGWGTKVIDTLSADLRSEFPDFKGLSVRNLKYMRSFAEAYPTFLSDREIANVQPEREDEIVQAPLAQFADATIPATVQGLLAQLTWYHHITLLDKVKDPEERHFYIHETATNGWSRNVMVHQVDADLYNRQGKAISNFSSTLPSPQSELAQQTLKNPYVLDFLSLSEEIKERELENALIQHLKKFMLELGKGFSYVGNQKNLVVEGDDYFLDLLFFNYILNCFVVVELKIGEFKPEYAGKLNFYVNTVNAQLKGKDHLPTIGVLLCKTPNETVVNYSLQGIESPIGVADYKLAKALPKALKSGIPSIKELEEEIDKEYEELKSPSQKRFDSLKEKLQHLKGGEISQTASIAVIFSIIDNSLMSLFKAIIERMLGLNELFMDIDYSWRGKEAKLITSVEEFASEWKDEEFLRSNYDFHFSYRFHGLKKSGTEAINSGFELIFRIDTYWYGITLPRFNAQPILRKLYHEQISPVEIDTIVETIQNFVMDEVEHKLEFIRNAAK